MVFLYWPYWTVRSIFGTFVLDGTEYFWPSHTGRTGRYVVFFVFHTGSIECFVPSHTGRTGRYGVFLVFSYWMVLNVNSVHACVELKKEIVVSPLLR